MLICGTVPIRDFPLTLGEIRFNGESLAINDLKIPCTLGTAALISAACITCEHLKIDPPQALLVGDIGEGKGSISLYNYLIKNISTLSPDVLVLHYILPVMGLMKKVCESLKRCPKRPIMIADASSMYAAKAAGLATRFDIFTPDLCEMAFLADVEATHPAYISRHLFNTDINHVHTLIETAYQTKGASQLLLIKGATDYVVKDGKVIDIIAEPDIPELEAIGGTGDIITGMVSAFVWAGLELDEATIIAAKANRVAGQYAKATPATKVWEIISHLPEVFKDNLCEWSGVCMKTGVRDQGPV